MATYLRFGNLQLAMLLLDSILKRCPPLSQWLLEQGLAIDIKAVKRKEADPDFYVLHFHVLPCPCAQNLQ